MPTVVSLGSVNVDRVAYVDEATVASLAADHDPFPDPGETVTMPDGIPDSFDPHVDERFLGGKGANQAVAAAAAGASTAFLGAVGEDASEFGVVERLSDRGVDATGIDRVPGPTGTAYVFVTPDGENRVAYAPGANGSVDSAYADAHRERILDADMLLLQNEIPVATTDHVLAWLDGVPDGDRPTVVLDPAPHEGAAKLLDHDSVDVATPNDHEFDALTPAFRSFDGVLVRTRGPDPIQVVTDRGSHEVHPPAVDAVDTTGAGDVFAGTLAARLADDDPIDRAVRVAATAAALSTERQGVQRAVPAAEAVRDRCWQ